MAETPVSLLDRLQDQPAPADWPRLVDLYTPLLRDWLSRYPALRQEDDDLVQEILRCVVAKVAEFRRRRTGSFRAWLRVITTNCINLYWRKQSGLPPAVGREKAEAVLSQLVDPNSSLDRSIDECCPASPTGSCMTGRAR